MSDRQQSQTAGPSAFSAYASRFLTGKTPPGRGGSGVEGSQVSFATRSEILRTPALGKAAALYVGGSDASSDGQVEGALRCSCRNVKRC